MCFRLSPRRKEIGCGTSEGETDNLVDRLEMLLIKE